ncbi:MAG: aminoacyl-tRNA hydrolase [Rhodospirillales bacterium]|nr:aminoacyl-tRNA hydrolase [Rhodospirillales bacterium]MCB9995445.1 aminoacyl-tRNA hydrolase [Rhodospirillales bacterium]
MSDLSKHKSDAPWLFVGLGNPGPEYAGNRHNIGFMVVDAMASEFGYPSWRSKFQGDLAEGRIDGHKVILLKPTTYMNNSGQAVKAAAKFYKINPDRIVIFHDELDLEPAKIRIKQGGGNAGHNGLKSIQAHMGTPDFWRVRLGIGHPGDKARVHGYVLRDFAKAEKGWVDAVVTASARHAGLLAGGDTANYLSKIAIDVKAAA